jgi:DNA-binding NarL/FixJ family response regulator
MSMRTPVGDVRVVLGVPLSATPGISVVARVKTGWEAVHETGRLRPEVLLIDVRMPELDGISVTREALKAAPRTAVLVLTDVRESESVFAAMRAGARGYLPGDAGEADIVRAVRGVAAGSAVFGEHVARQVLDMLFAVTPARPFPTLTTREEEVLDLLAAGQANHVIAQRLGLAPKTVRNHVSAVMTKLDTPSRAEAAERARLVGLGRPA